MLRKFQVSQVAGTERMQISAFIEHDDGIVCAAAGDTADRPAFFSYCCHPLVTAKTIRVRIENRLTDLVHRTQGADIAEIGSEHASTPEYPVATPAIRFSPKDRFANRGIARRLGFDGRCAQCLHECRELPNLLIRQIGGGHVGAGHAFLDCLE